MRIKAVPLLASALLSLATGFAATPAPAQVSGRLVTVFGNDPCPRDTICVRAPENERYRIPQELRGESGEAAAARWGERAKQLEYVGASGTLSCTPVGPGGATGCYRELARKAREEQKARGEEPAVRF